MAISRQHRQLIKIAGGINMLFLLLCVIMLVYLGSDPSSHSGIMKVLKFIFANSLCWIINLVLLVFVVPLAGLSKRARGILFYGLSFACTLSLGILISQSALYTVLSDDPIRHSISGPIVFVGGIDALSLVAIELILSRAAQANIRIEYANMEAENAMLRVKSLEAQHEKLKNQLHPHFLFNSLSALRSLIRRDPRLAEEYLLKLSGFLRFSISHNEQNIVPLKEELKFSLDYLEMQKIRFRSALQYTVNIPVAQLSDTLLPVFSLQLILENAIKHNQLTQDQPLCIGIQYLESGWLLVENNIQVKLSADPASGIGLKNLSDRYKLLAHDDIRIENNAELFQVYIKIIHP